jgi:SSS family solute:Na+ symporter
MTWIAAAILSIGIRMRSRGILGKALGLAVLAIMGRPSHAFAAPSGTIESGGGLVAIDWAIIAIYAVATIAMGWWYGRKHETTKEYFVGDGKMNPFLIGISLFATLLSTITYLSIPGETLGKGPVFLATMLGVPFVYWAVAYWLLPVYMRYRVTSAYELLEAKLGLSVRLLGAMMFLSLRLVWMSLLVYLMAKVIVVMADPAAETTGRDQYMVPLVAAVTGIVAVVYTTLGGLRAVVITDLFQSILLFGGALLVLIVASYDVGGLGWFPTTWQPHWDEQPFFSLDPNVRVTVVGSILTFFLWSVCTAGGDQTSVQRFMATTDLFAARRAVAVQMSAAVAVNLLLGLVGFALMAYFRKDPARLPDGMTIENNADVCFPLFVSHHLPIGISGLVISGMFAAAMSSLDSGVNSITAVIMSDFLDRFGLRPKTERGHVRAAQVLALTIGTIVVFGSTFMKFVPGNITSVTQKTSNLLTTPIFCLFVFALFIPFSRPLGVWAGAIAGTGTAAIIAFSGPLVVLLDSWGINPATFGATIETKTDPVTGAVSRFADDPISFQWIAPLAIAANLGVGCVVSLLLPRPQATPAPEANEVSP